jgi:hypothetical protein
MTPPPTSHFPAGYKSIILISFPTPANNMNFSFPYESFQNLQTVHLVQEAKVIQNCVDFRNLVTNLNPVLQMAFT